jgi:hypothetical protein
MSDQNLRVWPVEGDSYGDAIEYPRYAKYRMEPHYPGATGPRHTDLVVYERDAQGTEKVLGRHTVADVQIAFAGQGSPIPQASDPTLQGDRARNTPIEADSSDREYARTSPAPAADAGAYEGGTPDAPLGSDVEHVHEGDGSGPVEHVDNYDTLDEETLREELTYRGLADEGKTPGTTDEMVRVLREDDRTRQQDPPAPVGDNPHNL